MDKQVVYRARGAFRPAGDIQAIGAELESIRREYATQEHPSGEAPVDVIIERARDPESPLHGNFTWDQSEAARKYNLIEARRLWCCYEVVEVSRDRGQTEVEKIVRSPANVSVYIESGGRRYVSAVDGMAQKDTELQLINECEAQIRGIARRLECLKRLTVSDRVRKHLMKAATLLAATGATKRGPGRPPKQPQP